MFYKLLFFVRQGMVHVGNHRTDRKLICDLKSKHTENDLLFFILALAKKIILRLLGGEKRESYPLRTPRTKLSMKNDPITMRGTKYTKLKDPPRASLVCKHKKRELERESRGRIHHIFQY